MPAQFLPGGPDWLSSYDYAANVPTIGAPNPPLVARSLPYLDPLGARTTNPITAETAGELIGVAGQQCGKLTGTLRALCEAAVGVAGVVVGSGAPDNRGAGYTTPTCPSGWTAGPGGTCLPPTPGMGGTVQRTLPGGETGYGWAPTLGIYGAGVTPVAVMSQTRKCPRGHVLGNDGVCYRRGNVTKKDRAWNPGTKPLLTGGDVAALNKAKRLQKSIRRLATAHGPKKPCKCGIRKGKAVKV